MADPVHTESIDFIQNVKCYEDKYEFLSSKLLVHTITWLIY